jgi:hypothetical protein
MYTDLLSRSDDTMACGPNGSPRVSRRAAISALVVTGFVATMAIAPAASAAPGGSTVANVGVASGITMTGLTPSFTLTGTPGQTVLGAAAVTFNVETNNVTGYSVTVHSTTATMAPADVVGNIDTIPIAALTVRETGTSAFTPLSTGTVLVHSQAVRSANGGDALSNDFQIRIPVVNADTYSATLDYLATASL